MSGDAAARTGAYGAPVCSARIKAAPEDFRVEERAAEPATGRGEHLLLWIEKRGLATREVVQRLHIESRGFHGDFDGDVVAECRHANRHTVGSFFKDRKSKSFENVLDFAQAELSSQK